MKRPQKIQRKSAQKGENRDIALQELWSDVTNSNRKDMEKDSFVTGSISKEEEQSNKVISKSLMKSVLEQGNQEINGNKEHGKMVKE